MQNEQKVMYLSEGWFEAGITDTVGLDVSGGAKTTVGHTFPEGVTGGSVEIRDGCVQDYGEPYQPYYTTHYWWPTYESRKIRMTLSEVEHIRKVCKSDKKLRKAMQKIAPHIEVKVDFPG